MPKISYHTVNGVLLGETDEFGVRHDYLIDGVDSVIATVDQTPSIRNEYRYSPYGRFTAQLGPDVEPKFLWTGATGSRRSGAGHATNYNRARTYASETGRWTSVDPLWPGEPTYEYVAGNPARWTDPSGRQYIYITPLPRPSPFSDPCNKCADALWAAWEPAPAHKSNDGNAHKYTHCLACCVLTKLVSDECAQKKQDLQNHYDCIRRPRGCLERADYRLKACNNGKWFGGRPSTDGRASFEFCQAKCLNLYPLPKLPKPLPPLPSVPQCDPQNWSNGSYLPEQPISRRELCLREQF